MMETIDLPKTVVQAWGGEASRDFVTWLEERMIQASVQVQISAFVARQKVNVLMLEQVSNLLLAGEPVLERASGGDWQWRVPVELTFPEHGRVGQVGEVIVDARYGEVRYDETILARITDEARRLAQQTLSSAT
jgi:hypothetical protein